MWRHLSPIMSVVLLASAAAGANAAEAYPSRPIRMIVPFATGGNADILGRVIGQGLTSALGQQVVIDNRPGANGVIGTDLAAKAPPDGHTLLFVATGHATNPSLYDKLPFDPVRDFAPVGLTSRTPLLLAVTPSLPARSVKELIAIAKNRPRELSFASAGNGSSAHLAGALFNTLTGVEIVHVPYKSTAQATIDLIGGRMQVIYPSITSVLLHVKAGKVRALAITSAKRSALVPDLPTVAESGVPGYEAAIWNGVLAPAATRGVVVRRLNAALVATTRSTEMKERVASMGADATSSTPEAFAAFIKSEIAKWGRIIAASGAKID
ncbi:MAG: tripartite tricarboxylate transporter substrate binding protein [Betaproteobacteria bacterium]|nr:tripartite tricarboxylate transporter substrate binding protein [Betaproteobacteria bacterium]MBI3936090.1 tripartite tricarboxylate transporter substrate binding protein [Betaproteobacteria bacterium]